MRKLGDPLALLFDWPVRHAVHLGLPLALAVSALAHAGGLLAFILAPVPTIDVFRRSAEIYFLPDAHPQTRHLSLAAEADDPSLFSPSAVENRSAWNFSETSYPPSYEGWEPKFQRLPEPGLARLPPVTPKAPVHPRPMPSPAENSAFEARPLTKITLAGGLEDRPFQPPKNTSYQSPRRQSLSPSEFLVSVAPDGLILHVFPIVSSGNETLDQAAIRTLFEGRFAMRDEPLPAWGTVTFLWGDDVEPLSNE